jgi:hypothetical protein
MRKGGKATGRANWISALYVILKNTNFMSPLIDQRRALDFDERKDPLLQEVSSFYRQMSTCPGPAIQLSSNARKLRLIG